MITNSAVRINPALVITQDEAGLGTEAIKRIFDAMERERLHLQ
jgi:hypothetical protein